jgi:DNA-binding PadR family transcriptional regulator
MRITTTTARILAALLAEPDTDRYGLEIMKATGLASGSLYPVLHRLQAAGWVSAHWEEIDPAQARRPARRFYRLTPLGVTEARQALSRLQRQITTPGLLGGAQGSLAW